MQLVGFRGTELRARGLMTKELRSMTTSGALTVLTQQPVSYLKFNDKSYISLINLGHSSIAICSYLGWLRQVLEI